MGIVDRIKTLIRPLADAQDGKATAEFERIYRERAWGETTNESVFSGWGSAPDRSREYDDFLVNLIEKNPIDNVVDVGCGDFRVFKRVLDRIDRKIEYIGLDIVRELIDHVKREYGTDGVDFRCIGLHEPYPKADLLVFRQVFQHNNNENIRRMLRNAEGAAPFLLVAEHVPKHPKAFNLDMPTGPSTRMDFGSGVYVEEPPFSLSIDEECIVDWGGDGCLRVTLSRRSI